MKISAVIITLNEEDNIADAIRSVNFADEVVVVDSGSTDRTRDIAGSMGARVIVNAWPGFSAQKQFAADSARNDWILSLDADEIVSPALAKEIVETFSKGKTVDGYRIPRLSTYLGRQIRHGGWYPDRQLRLFLRHKGKWNGRIIHESVEMEPGSRIGRLNGEILHRTVTSPAEHDRMIRDRYAPLAAEQMFREGRRSTPTRAVTSAITAFLRAYILRLGFLDLYPGLSIAYFAGKHNYLKYRHLAELQSRARESEGPVTTTNQ